MDHTSSLQADVSGGDSTMSRGSEGMLGAAWRWFRHPSTPARFRRAGIVAASTAVIVAGLGVAPAQAVSVCTVTTATSGPDTVVTFESPVANDSCTGAWTPPAGVSTVALLAVAGGGEGGVPTPVASAGPGGGGAGEVVEQSSLAVSGTLAITVGAGGTNASLSAARQGTDGGDTTITGGATITAHGGGGGGAADNTGTSVLINGRPGGSGGGGGMDTVSRGTGGSSTAVSPGVGFAGGGAGSGPPGASGGGAGGAGGTSSSGTGVVGGLGITSTIPVTATLVGQGGRANITSNPTPVAATVIGGGGAGVSGTLNPTQSLIAGVNGIVVIRYVTPVTPPAPNPPGEGGGEEAPAPPGPPTPVTTTPGPGEVTVSWRPPANPGTFPVTRYVVTVDGADTWCAVNAPATSCIVPGLTPGQTYTFTVVAVGEGGISGPATAMGTPYDPLDPTTQPEGSEQRLDGPELPDEGVGEGSTVVLVDGRPVAPEVTFVPAKVPTTVEITAPAWTMKMQTRVGTLVEPLSPAHALVLEPSRAGMVRTFGSGFKPGSPVRVFILPGIDLGSVVVGADGSFDGLVALPASLPAGILTLQVNGLGADGSVRSANLGVRVGAASARTLRERVLFASLSSTLTTQARHDLRALARAVGQARSMSIVLGFVQPVGVTSNDHSLSRARAYAVADFLRAEGVRGSMTVRGGGRAAQQGAVARRVDVTIRVGR